MTWDKNKSPVGWYLASILMRFQGNDEDFDNPERECLAWENQILIKADTPEEAYQKATAHGNLEQENGDCWDDDNKNRKGNWYFEGLTSLLPIYEELADGAEISWLEYKNKSVKDIQSRVKAKEDLEVFSDNV